MPLKRKLLTRIKNGRKIDFAKVPWWELSSFSTKDALNFENLIYSGFATKPFLWKEKS